MYDFAISSITLEELEGIKTIEFRDFSFKYVGDELYTLKNISVKLNEGEKWRVSFPRREKYEVSSLQISGKGTSAEVQRNGDYIITMGTEDAYITVNWEYNKFRIV